MQKFLKETHNPKKTKTSRGRRKWPQPSQSFRDSFSLGRGGQPSQWGGYLLHVCTEGVLLSHNLPMAAVAERFPTVVESLKLLIWHLLQ